MLCISPLWQCILQHLKKHLARVSVEFCSFPTSHTMPDWHTVELSKSALLSVLSMFEVMCFLSLTQPDILKQMMESVDNTTGGLQHLSN